MTINIEEEKNRSNKNLIQGFINKYAPQKTTNDMIKFEEEKNNCKNLSQDEIISHLSEKREEAEKKKEQDLANYYDVAIAVLKDLWAKKISEGEQRKMAAFLQKHKIEQEYATLSESAKIEQACQILKNNLKKSQFRELAQKIIKDNQKIIPTIKRYFNNKATLLLNSFDESKEQQSCMTRSFCG